MLANILIAFKDWQMMYMLGGFGDRLRSENFVVTEIPIFMPEGNCLEKLQEVMTGKSIENDGFDLVIVFDEYEYILDSIKKLIPTKIPVIYADIFSETEPVKGFTWLRGCILPSRLLNAVEEQLKK